VPTLYENKGQKKSKDFSCGVEKRFLFIGTPKKESAVWSGASRLSSGTCKKLSMLTWGRGTKRKKNIKTTGKLKGEEKNQEG